MLFFQKQPMMRRVLLAILPVYAYACWLYGLPLAILTAGVIPASIISEYIFKRLTAPKEKKIQVTEANLVTALLFTLSLPPAVPVWIAVIGIVFAVVIVKEAFGGFGRNIFNPAISGRLFVYLTFAPPMTTGFVSSGTFGIDATSAATPMALIKQGAAPDIMPLLTGVRSGSIGESAIILIILSGVFLIATRTASFRIILSTIASATLLAGSLWLAGTGGVYAPHVMLLTGSILFVSVFFATDPVSAPKKALAQWVYGIVIGSSTVLIRFFAPWAEGTSFAVLVGNTFAPLLDDLFTKRETNENAG